MPGTRASIDMDTDVEFVPQIVKHSSLYFTDGNIILSVVHNDQLHLFRCHKSVLAKHSPVFRNLFESVQDGADAEEYDGVPCVTLPDTFEDVNALLTLLYDPLKLPYRQHDPATARTLHGPLKLATKYQMTSLRKRFISILQADWPSDLNGWDNNEAEMTKTMLTHCGDIPPFPEPARVIRLAKECNVPSLLPAAFYHLGRCYDAKFVENKKYNTADIKLLTTEDWQWLLHGHDHFRATLARFLRDFLTERRLIDVKNICNNSSQEQPDPWGCKKSVRDWWKTTCFEMLPDILWVDPLQELLALSNKAESAQFVCKHCRRWIQDHLASQRHRIWSDLDFFYGLDLEQPS